MKTRPIKWAQRAIVPLAAAAAFAWAAPPASLSVTSGATQAASPQEIGQAGARSRTLRATDLMGRDVVDQGGRKLGVIVDSLLDLDAGRVRHVVRCDASGSGAGKFFTVPPQRLRLSPTGGDVVFTAGRGRFEDAGNDPAERSACLFGDHSGIAEVDGGGRLSRAAAGGNTRRFSELVGSEIGDGRIVIGTLADMVIDPVRGDVRYMLLDVGPQGPGGDTHQSFPMAVLKPSDAVLLDREVADVSPERFDDSGPAPASTFRGLDTNGDGWLTPPETSVNGSIDGTFPRLDRNGDGRLSRAEFDAAPGMPSAR